MITAKELYKTLSADFKTERNFYFADRGEGMLQGREKGTNRLFLVNKELKKAWELLDKKGTFSQWDASAVEIASVLDIPYQAQRNAVELRAPYYFGINEFEDGVAYLSWTLQPDGRYYADEDGYGMEDDDEITLYAFIDTESNILVPFQPMDEALKSRYREQAKITAKNREEVPYVCLAPDLTIPESENERLKDHEGKLRKIIYGMMVQFGSQSQNAYKHTEYEGRLGILTAINPNPDHNLQYAIIGELKEGTDDTYIIKTVTCLYHKGHEPKGLCTLIGEYNTGEIDEIMRIEDNITLFLDDFIDSATKIYTE